MVTEKVKYTDYNGNERVETCYFNLTKAELISLDKSFGVGGFEKVANKAAEEQDVGAMLDIFGEVIRRSYGIKSDDGSRFIKDKEKTEAFLSSEAYSELLLSVFSDPDKARTFTAKLINVPAN